MISTNTFTSFEVLRNISNLLFSFLKFIACCSCFTVSSYILGLGFMIWREFHFLALKLPLLLAATLTFVLVQLDFLLMEKVRIEINYLLRRTSMI